MERARSSSPRLRSTSAYLHQALQLAGAHCRYFWYSVRTRSISPSCSSSSMYDLRQPELRVYFMFWLNGHTLGTFVKPHSYRQQRQLLELLVLIDREIIAP